MKNNDIETVSEEVRLARIELAKEVGKVFDKNTVTLSDFRDRVEKLGFTVRIAKVNGERQVLTMDYRMNRINVEVSGATETIEKVLIDSDMKKYYPDQEHFEYKSFDTTPAFVDKIASFG